MTRMRVSLVTLGDPNQQTGGYLYHRRLVEAAPAHDAEMRFVSFPPAAFPLPALWGHRVMSESSVADVVVIDSIATAFAAPWLRGVKRPLVGMLHQRPGGIDHGIARTQVQALLDRKAYRWMRTLLVASQSLRDELTVLHPDVRVVAPGRDVATIEDAEHRDLRRGRGTAFLCVGNWIPRKGIVELLDSFALLPQSAATLHLVGDDGTDPRYARAVRRRLDVLGDRVVVHGVIPREQVGALYRDADVFVMPSFEEPYGTVYGEAMAAGLPVVGWRAGNLPYLARDQREGVLVDPGDLAGLARALQRLAEDGEFRKSLAKGARTRAASLPTWEETAVAFFSALRAVWPPL